MTDSLSTTDELKELMVQATTIAENTKSAATKRAYRGDWRQFERWCEGHQIESFPTNSQAVALYMVHLNQLGRKPSTIRRALTSINQKHLLADLPGPVDARVLELKKGIHRTRGRRTNKKVAITLDRLRRMIRLTATDFVGRRDRALLLLGWAAALRRSEIVAIHVEHLEELTEGLALTLPSSKTDQEGFGRKIGIPFVDQETALCPVRAVQLWCNLARIKTGPVFRPVFKGGEGRFFGRSQKNALSDRAVSLIIKNAAKRAGYDPSEYSGHSLRSGLTTTLAADGATETQIMGITGHKSSKMVREYIQEGGLFVNHPLVSLFSDQ